MYYIGIQYKTQAIRTSDVAICFEKCASEALSEVNIYSNFTSFDLNFGGSFPFDGLWKK